MNWGVVLTGIGILLGVIGSLGGAVGYFSSNRAQATIRVQTDLLSTLEKQVEILKVENQECHARTTEQGAQITALTEAVTHAADVKGLSELTESRHQEVLTLVRTQHDQLIEVLNALTETAGKKPAAKKRGAR